MQHPPSPASVPTASFVSTRAVRALRAAALLAGLLSAAAAEGSAQTTAATPARPTVPAPATRAVVRPAANTVTAKPTPSRGGVMRAGAAKPGAKSTTASAKSPTAKSVPAKGVAAKGIAAKSTARPAARSSAFTGRDPAPVLAAAGEVAPSDSGTTGSAAAVDASTPFDNSVSGTGAARMTHYRSARDSIAGEAARVAATRSRGLRLVVSLDDRELHVLDGADTLLVAPVAIGMDTTIRYGARSWTFETPRGRRTVLGKLENPVWIPPEWHYAEVASRRGMELAHMPERGSLPIGGGRRLTVRGGLAGVIMPGGKFEALPLDEEIVFGNTLYVPPANSENRKIPGELGRFRLDLGNGYQIHGTPHEDTIGDAATHGCIRLYDEDIEWLFQHIPVGTPVYIY